MNLHFVLQQSLAFLVVTYAAFIGGSQSGLVFFRMRRLNVLLLAVVLLLWLLSMVRRRTRCPRTRLDLVWVVWLLVQGVATACSIHPRRGLTPLALSTVYCLVFYMTVDLLRASRYDTLVPTTLILLGLVAMGPGLLEMVSWYRSWHTLGGWNEPLPPATTRLQSIAAHPNHLAATLNLALPFGLALWIDSRDVLVRGALGLWLFLGTVLLVGTSSRGGWVAASVGLGSFTTLVALNRRDWVIERWVAIRSRPLLLVLLGAGLLVILAGLGRLSFLMAQHPTHGPLFASRQGLWEPVWLTLREHPISGAGPLTYVIQAVKTHSIPPYPLSSHAHSFPLTTLLESGLVGVLGLTAFCAAVVHSAWLQWRRRGASHRSPLIAAFAALAATGVHSLFETPQTIPGFSLLVVLILAYLERDAPPARRFSTELARVVFLGFGTVALVVGSCLSLPCQTDYAAGIALANAGVYDTATVAIRGVAERDPGLASNWFQAAYAGARAGLASGDAIQVHEASSFYRRGLGIDPTLSIHWAQLGALLRQMEDHAGAREAFNQAISRAPREAAYTLTLGVLEEEAGNLDAAANLYSRGLSLRPAWADSSFWRRTRVRRATRDAWQEAKSVGSGPLPDCWRLLTASKLDAARACFEDARALNDPEPLYGLAATSRAAGDLGTSRTYLRKALWIADTSPRSISRRRAAVFRFALSDTLAESGDVKNAALQLQIALEGLKKHDLTRGLGLTTEYTWFAFYREAIVDELLPGVVWIWVTDEVEERMWQLAGYYEVLGQPAAAARVYEEIAEGVPERSEALERAEMLRSEKDSGP